MRIHHRLTTSVLVVLVVLGLGRISPVRADSSPMLPAGRTVVPRQDAGVRMESEHVKIRVSPVAEEEWIPANERIKAMPRYRAQVQARFLQV